MLKVGINGFGRIGRSFFRAALENEQVEIVALNDLTDPKTLAHLLQYDSIMGTLQMSLGADEENLLLEEKKIRVFKERDPGKIPWKDWGVDVVIEATGLFTEKSKAELHITKGGAKRVILSAPGKNEDLMVVLGVNEELYDPSKHKVVSNGSCTTNGLAPVVKVLNDVFGIEQGLMNTTHAYTQSQALLDKPESNLRGARAAALSIVPYSSGAAKAIGKVIPELSGKLDGYSLRVPVPVVSVVDLTVNLKKPTTAKEVNQAFLKASQEGPLKGVLGYCEAPLVSTDFKGDPRSSIIDAPSTLMVGEKMVKVLAWYDNEWGFSNRLLDLALLMERKGV